MLTPLYSVANLDFHPAHMLHPSPTVWRDQVIYFLMVDRFDDGKPDTPEYAPGNAHPDGNPQEGSRFQGGTIRGIIRRLDYIKGLGCTTIWLSPIFKNRLDLEDTYHGYGIQDYLAIDPRFGTVEDVQLLTAEAHARGMYVILDIVLNHTGDTWSYADGWRYFYDHGRQFDFGTFREFDPAPGLQLDDGVWPVELQDKDAFKRQGEIRNWNDKVERENGDFYGFKELEIRSKRVLDTLIRIHKYWLSELDIDGYRLDAVKHIEYTAIALFCNAIHEYAREVGKQNFLMFGEILDTDQIIIEYLKRNAVTEGGTERFPSLDAALDFPLGNVLGPVIKGQINAVALRERYNVFHTLYADHGKASENFVTFLETHDQNARFLADADDERQAILGLGYLLTSQGIPCLYYGTEVGFRGAGDTREYVRECMFGGKWGGFRTQGVHFFNPGHPIYQGVSAIAEVRREQPALRYGRQYFREISGDGKGFGHPIDGDCTLAWSRILDLDEVMVAMNLSGHDRADWVRIESDLSAPGRMMRDLLRPGNGHLIEWRNGVPCVRIPLPAYGMAILKCD